MIGVEDLLEEDPEGHIGRSALMSPDEDIAYAGQGVLR
jgi:hypothetical protein